MALTRVRAKLRMLLVMFGKILTQNLQIRTLGPPVISGEDTDFIPDFVTGANDTQHSIPEFLTGRFHSQPDLQRKESAHDTTMNTTLPAAATVPVAQQQDPINLLAHVLVNLHNKPQAVTIRTVTTTPITYDGKTENFELIENLFHTMIKMQP